MKNLLDLYTGYKTKSPLTRGLLETLKENRISFKRQKQKKH